jgi:hypothetical protein
MTNSEYFNNYEEKHFQQHRPEAQELKPYLLKSNHKDQQRLLYMVISFPTF